LDRLWVSLGLRTRERHQEVKRWSGAKFLSLFFFSFIFGTKGLNENQLQTEDAIVEVPELRLRREEEQRPGCQAG
jgi:hypothetical protein